MITFSLKWPSPPKSGSFRVRSTEQSAGIKIVGFWPRYYAINMEKVRWWSMKYIHITKENIDREHICCAMSGKQALAKKGVAEAALWWGTCLLSQWGAWKVLYRIYSSGKRMGTHWSRRLALYQLPLGFRLHEGTRLFLRTAFRVYPGRERTGKERYLHSVRRGTETGIFSWSEISEV